jgi:hypothetical protein
MLSNSWTGYESYPSTCKVSSHLMREGRALFTTRFSPQHSIWTYQSRCVHFYDNVTGKHWQLYCWKATFPSSMSQKYRRVEHLMCSCLLVFFFSLSFSVITVMGSSCNQSYPSVLVFPNLLLLTFLSCSSLLCNTFPNLVFASWGLFSSWARSLLFSCWNLLWDSLFIILKHYCICFFCHLLVYLLVFLSFKFSVCFHFLFSLPLGFSFCTSQSHLLLVH